MLLECKKCTANPFEPTGKPIFFAKILDDLRALSEYFGTTQNCASLVRGHLMSAWDAGDTEKIFGILIGKCTVFSDDPNKLLLDARNIHVNIIICKGAAETMLKVQDLWDSIEDL